ncbi:hypothetical protein G9A89_012726 [Geosiphon pyriformis]|nr:hypothetical protein G9A89_012726 [Geosiphon pyriformis]
MIPSESPQGTLPININPRRPNVYYLSRQPHHSLNCSPHNYHRTHGSYGSCTSSPASPSLRSMRRNSLITQNNDLFGSLVGSYEESILNGRMSTAPSKPITFIAQIGVLGKGKCKSSLKCPPHINLVFPAYFYDLVEEDSPTPYVGNVDLENRLIGEPYKKFPGGYRLPMKGQLQVIIKNPNKTAVKFFLIPYDFADMPAGSKTFLRQKSYTIPEEFRQSTRPTLRYAIHLQFCSPAKKKLYLYKYIRVVFANRVPDGSEKLRIECEGPGEPKYIPICTSGMQVLLGLSNEDEDKKAKWKTNIPSNIEEIPDQEGK